MSVSAANSVVSANSLSKKSNNHSLSSPMHRKEDSFVGKYCLLKTIGCGNFAKVKLARHMLTNQRVAIKIIDKSKLDKSGLKKLYREVRILKLLTHPNIVKLYEVIEHEKTMYLVMEYLSGGEVFDYLVSHGRLKEEEARRVFRQIVSAVFFCHRNHVVHRDLKAENLLLDGKMNVKIADFGFSNEFSPRDKLDTFCGSPPYAAPELFRGELYTGPEVDVWSLGVVLYTLVSGSLPFDGKDIKEVRDKVLVGKYHVPSSMSCECHQLVKKLLVLSSDKRPNLKIILSDKWLNLGYENMNLAHHVSDSIIIDYSKIDLMVRMGYSREAVVESVEKQKFDEMMATYNIIDSKVVKMMRGSESSNGPRPNSTQENPQRLRDIRHTTKRDENFGEYRVGTLGGGLRTLPPFKMKTYENAFKLGESSLRKINNVDSVASFSSVKKSTMKPSTNRAADLRLETAVRRVSLMESTPQRANVKGVVATEFTRRNSFQHDPFSLKVPAKKKDEEKPRVLRFTWSMKTTTVLPPHEILVEVFRVLEELSISHNQREKYLIFCMYGDPVYPESYVEWEMEICQLPRISLNGIKFKRVMGTSTAFKEMALKVSNLLKL